MILFEAVNLLINIPDNFALLGISALTLIISGFAFWNAQSLEISSVDIPIKNLQNEVKIMHLSDIHLGIFRGKSFFDDIVNKTNELDPDIVLITGDIIDSDLDNVEKILNPLKKLKADVYFTNGNHEYYVGIDTVLFTLRKYGVTVLSNETVIINDLQIIGLDYMNADPESFDMHSVSSLTIKDVLPQMNITADMPSVLLHHSPVGIEYVNQEKNRFNAFRSYSRGTVFPD